MRVPFVLQHDDARFLPVNAFAEANPQDSKTPVTIRAVQGLDSFGGGTFSGASGVVRGMCALNGERYAVIGDDLYKFTALGGLINVGTVPNVDYVRMAASADELVILTNGAGYVYDGSSTTLISDGDFLSSRDVAYLDGYHIFIEEDSNRFFLSDLNDATAYDSTNRARAEGGPDNLVALLVDHREVWMFGELTTEVWVNTGGTFPLERLGGAFLERGCASTGAPAKEDNTVFWLGENGICYRAVGYVPQRISTHAIERMIAPWTWTSAEGYTYTENGHPFYVLTFPEGTIAYDISTNLWHRRSSYLRDHFRATTHIRVGGTNYFGDSFSPSVLTSSSTTHEDNGEPFIRSLHTAPIHQDRRNVFHHRIEFDLQNGVAGVSEPKCMLDASDDGGKTWAGLPDNTIGAIGNYKHRTAWHALGMSKERLYRLQVSDAVEFTVKDGTAEVTLGEF